MLTSVYKKFSAQVPEYLIQIIVCILLGAAWFLLLYDRFSLDFSYVDWIYASGGDVFQHQMGWEWFRQEPWRFPLGRIEAYGYPFGTYLSYMDSIPLLAIPLKFLSPWLGRDFQYQGAWELASIIGQLLIGMFILNNFSRSIPNKILGVSILVLTPPMIARTFSHDSLTAHWILLAGIWFILLEYRHKLWRGAWIVLIAVAILVHLYFVAMLVPLWAIGLFFRYKSEKKIGSIIAEIILVFGAILLIGYSIGLFSLSSDILAGDGFGRYSWNLNGFINPTSYSSFLKGMKIGTVGQYEGFSYLGLGNLFLIFTSVFLFLQKDISRRRLSFFLPFILVGLLFVTYSLSKKAYWGSQILWDVQLPGLISSVFSMFHSSGRFIWPVFYFLVLFGLISILRNYRYPALIFVIILVIQFIDIQPLIQSKKFKGIKEYKTSLQAEFWQKSAETNQHIILIPASWSASSIYEPFALYARQNKLTLNWGYFARGKYGEIEGYGEQVLEDLKKGLEDTQTIYILWDPDRLEPARKLLSNHMLICQVDSYTVVLSIDNKLAQTKFDLTRYCSVPSP